LWIAKNGVGQLKPLIRQPFQQYGQCIVGAARIDLALQPDDG
jgi:hypothetical protein